PITNNKILFWLAFPLTLTGLWGGEVQAQDIDIIDNPELEQPGQPELVPDLSLEPTEVRILMPQGGSTTATTTNLIIQYNADSEVDVRLNGEPLNADIPTTTEPDESNNIVTQVWYGVELEIGENEIQVSANNGAPRTLGINVTLPEAEIEINAVGEPRIPADNRSTITLEGAVTDEDGAFLTETTLVTLTASSGEFVGADQDPELPGFQVRAEEGKFQAQLRSGLEAQRVQVRAALVPEEVANLKPQETVEAYTQVEFTTYLRPSLVSGVIDFRVGPAGTNYWGSRSTFLNPDVISEGTQVDFTGAVFATGAIGDWLFTGAYNSARPLNQTCDGITRLFRGPQFCEQQYPVYGDSSTTDYTTPSIDSVYARIERNSPVEGAGTDYFMWGDYHTPEFARASQEFSAITRELHGFKGNFNFGNLQVSAAFSPDVRGFQRDTILPDGTSGYYFLSNRLLVPGSETIFLEVEEVNRPGVVIERKQLLRGPDYEIDYDRGTLLFRRPIDPISYFNEDSNRPLTSVTTVRKIVATYQYEGNGETDTHLYAGRVQYNFDNSFENASWVGASYFQEDQGSQELEIIGVDFLLSLGDMPDSEMSRGRIAGEFARSNANNYSLFNSNSTFINQGTQGSLGNPSGSAYRLEADVNLSEQVTARAYYRNVEPGFVNNATISYKPGQTRYGMAVNADLGEATQLFASYDYERNYGNAATPRTSLFDQFNPAVDLFNPTQEALRTTNIDNELATFRVGARHDFGRIESSLEYVYRDRSDNVGTLFNTNTSQLVANVLVPILCEDTECDRSTLAFRAQSEMSLGDNDPLYPLRTTMGIEWAVQPGMKLRLAHQFYNGGLLGANSLTSLDAIAETKLGENTTFTSRYGVVSGFNGMTGQSAIGLNHRINLFEGFRVDLGYERIATDIFSTTAAGPRFAQPYAVGQSAASLGLTEGDSYSVGFSYTANPDFKASGRLEYRNSSYGNNVVISAAAAGKLTPALTGLLRFQQASSATPFLEGLGPTASLRMGLAYRDPYDDRFNGLFSYEYRRNPSTIPDTLLFDSGVGSTDHVLSAEGIYAPNWQWEFYSKFAMRSSTTYLSSNFSNSSLVYLGQLRGTYRFAYQWDVALEGRTIGQPSANFTEWGWAAELGYYIMPDLRIGLGYSFGSVDDRDFSGYRSSDGIYFGVTYKINELFGGFGNQTPVQSTVNSQQSSESGAVGNRQSAVGEAVDGDTQENN
ncbi:MAG: TonB-dependent receptor, partial [Jaaginema sp. PMC 1078.18]|nr:TonB-dependent receptor [Jaaginema sp. PMC 1078.18]